MLKLSLSPSDWAYHQSMSATFADPFVFHGAIDGAVFCGLLSFPFVYYALRTLRLLTAAPFVLGVVLGEILAVTPFVGWFGFFGALPALAGALLVCKFSGWRAFAPKRVVARCTSPGAPEYEPRCKRKSIRRCLWVLRTVKIWAGRKRGVDGMLPGRRTRPTGLKTKCRNCKSSVRWGCRSQIRTVSAIPCNPELTRPGRRNSSDR